MRSFAEERLQNPGGRTAARRPAPPGPSPLLALQRSAGNAAVTMLLQGRNHPVSLQRCGGTPPEECPCNDDAITSDSAPVPAVQRACVEDAAGNKQWKYEYDGCSLPFSVALSLGGMMLGGRAKDDPAGGGDRTAFALGKPTTAGGVACDRHDECYQSCGTSKDECDQRMYADMRATCASAPPALRQKCDAAAVVYYNGLKRLPQAQEAFDDRKKAVCACEPGKVPPSQTFPPRALLRSPRTGRPLSWLDYQLILPRLAGYRVFRDQEEYARYLRGEPQTAPPSRREGSVPRTLRMR